MTPLVWLTTEDLRMFQQTLDILGAEIRELESEYGPSPSDEELKAEFSHIIQLFREHGDIGSKLTKLITRIVKRENIPEDPSYYGLPEHFDIEQAEMTFIASALTTLSTSIEDITTLLHDPDKYKLKVKNLELQMELDTVTEESAGFRALWQLGLQDVTSVTEMAGKALRNCGERIAELQEGIIKHSLDTKELEVEKRGFLEYVEQLEFDILQRDIKISELEGTNSKLVEGNNAAVELVESLESKLEKMSQEKYELEIKYEKKESRLSDYRRENGRLNNELHNVRMAPRASNPAPRNPDNIGSPRPSKATKNAIATDPNAWLERDLDDNDDSDEARPTTAAGPVQDSNERRPGYHWRDGSWCRNPKKRKAGIKVET
ncbi:hypothetical protein BDZ45DRAFT_688127 [Acephala macrosclerotiorum]|nr:hypothetical protein BDZ45DRAFT_688127 [Acephala macrosclerotiorum]